MSAVPSCPVCPGWPHALPSSQTDWIAFAVASALTILGPYVVYSTNARKLNLSDPVATKKKL